MCEVTFDLSLLVEIKRAFYFHRDIKAGNILLGDDGTVQIAGDIFTAQTLEFTGQITFSFFCYT